MISRSSSCAATCRRGSGRWMRDRCTPRFSRPRACTASTFTSESPHISTHRRGYPPPARARSRSRFARRTPSRGEVIRALNDRETEVATRAERAFLAALEGGCQVPIGSLVVGARLHGFISSVDGRHSLRDEIELDRESPESSGRALAKRLRDRGADDILARLQRLNRAPSPQPE